MQGRRILIFVVVFLITLPIVTVAADSAEKSAEDGLLIRLGDLHEGERFVYDLHLTSQYRDLDWHIPAFFDIQIERDRAFQTLDGAVHDALVTKVQQRHAAWDAHEPRWENTTQYLRIRDGVYLERFEESRKALWQAPDGEGEETIWDRALRIEGNGNGGDLYGRGMHPGSVYVHGNIVQQVFASMLMRTDGRVSEVAEWNGDKVYDIDGHDRTDSDAGARFHCQLDHPELQYTDFEAEDELATSRLVEHYTRSTWIRPDRAFPVLNECHATYHDGDDLIEELHLTLELTQYEPGGAKILVDWDRRNTRGNFQPAGTLEAQPTTHAGVPPGGSALGVPLPRAIDLVARHEDPQLKAWMDDDQRPFWLVAAQYAPRLRQVHDDPDTPAGPLPLPVTAPVPSGPPDPSDPTNPPEPGTHLEREGVQWHLTLANRAGQARQVLAIFDEIEPGVFDAGRIDRVEPTRDEDALVDGRLTDRLVSLDALVSGFLTEVGVGADQWMHEHGDGVDIRNTISDDGDRGYRVFHTVTLAAEDPHAAPGDERNPRVVRMYDTRDGAPLQSGSTASWTVPSTASDEPSYQPASAALPVRSDLFPAAATASGLALALGFAMAFFWDTVARTFGQFIGAPLHAKIHKDKVLDHKTRDRIVDQVAQNPGIAVEELRRELAVGYGTVCHHLATLQRNGLVISRKIGRRRCYFVPGAVDAQAMAAVGASGTQAAGRFLDVVTAEPGLSQSEVALRLGVADSSVRYQAKRLLAHDRLRAERDGRTVRYYPAGDAAAAS